MVDDTAPKFGGLLYFSGTTTILQHHCIGWMLVVLLERKCLALFIIEIIIVASIPGTKELFMGMQSCYFRGGNK